VLFDRSLLGDLQTTENTTQQSTQNGVTTSILEIIQAASNLPGFDFNSIGPLGNSGSDQSVLTANQVGSQGISNFQVGRSNDQLGFGGLVLSASSQNISVLVRALQENNQLEILSRPQIRTLDNQPAFIQVGERVPRITSSQVTVNGQTNQVVLENVGLILGVTPRISPTGTVIMEIDAEKSDLGAESKGIPVSVSLNGTVVRSPRIETTTAQATVSAADGETVILGGLITKKTDEIHRKVPVLGDLPLLNNLFRFDSVVTTRTELLIILTPKVIRNSKDNERIKQAEMARMSWCAADVYDMHGDIDYMIDPELLLPNEADTEVIYPDQNPRGTSSRRSTPTEPPLPPEPEDTQSLLIPLDPSGERLPIGVGVEAQPLPMPDSGEGRRSREVQPTFWQENSRETVTRNR
ncbi:MAG: type II and III secretion system protein, partial [Planctomycetota bacterium]|nr:type II and III secretion system protein [Planctomycetota bacterium]